MRISDWSSDVCSSDLGAERPGERIPRRHSRELTLPFSPERARGEPSVCDDDAQQQSVRPRRLDHDVARSEEHTSELQSLMRISYAVFCLKKNTDIIYHPSIVEHYVKPYTCHTDK